MSKTEDNIAWSNQKLWIKMEFLMRNATRHNFNVILLNCGMNIQIRKIQDKSLILT